MSSSRDRWVLWATVVSESAWLSSVLAVAALALQLDRSPLSWPAMLLILGLGLAIVRMGPSKTTAIELLVLIRVLIGAVVIYLAVGTQVATATNGVDLGWAIRAASGSESGGYTLGAVAGSIIAALLLLRGGMLAKVEVPTDSLSLSFRLGFPAMAFAAAVDIAHTADLNTFPLIFVFFGAGLAGLSVGHLLPGSSESAKARTWPRVITGLVSSVLVAGLVLGVLSRAVASPGDVLSTVARVIAWIIVVPIAVVFTLFFTLVEKIFNRPYNPDFEEAAALAAATSTRAGSLLFQRLGETTTQALEEQADQQAGLFEQVLEVVTALFVGIVVIAVLVLLAVLFAQMFKGGRRRSTQGTRESVSEDSNPLSDMARLLFGLMPKWLRKGQRKPKHRLPDGPSGVVDVLRIYYRMLALAEKKGVQRRPHETATEFQKSLEAMFPRDLVRMLTEAFNRAFYGHHPASKEQIAQMRSSLRGLTIGPT